MLLEIYCEKFHQKRIEFSDGFNVVIGTNTGTNSIGKSTFMLIIDFVFGGNKYSDETDILNKVGEHYICFKFKFDKEVYSFSRSNVERNIVWKCNPDYEKKVSFTLKEYCNWLAEKYGIEFNDLSFRNAVGRYIRAYGKDNCNEKLPLHSVSKESASEASIALLKILNHYGIIADIEKRAKNSEEQYKTYTKAQKLNLVTKIKKRDYEKNIKEIVSLQSEINELSSGLDHGLLDVDAVASEEAINLKKRLSRAKRLRSGIKSKISVLNENEEYAFSPTTKSFDELEKFFPGTNIKHIEEIEVFHTKISKIFKNELQEAKRELNKQLVEYDEIISDLEQQLQQLIHNPNLSRIILKKYSDCMTQIEKLDKENKAYLKYEELKRIKKDDAKSLIDAKNKQFGIIEKMINEKMEQINRKLYKEQYNSPILHFTDNNYTFSTPNDTGTGIAYKGLVVFDLSIMSLANLPILVHDSVVLKQISDEAIESIINQYIDCKSQVVIALDKQESYSKNTTDLLEKYTVLRLAANGKELFGRSWGKKNN